MTTDQIIAVAVPTAAVIVSAILARADSRSADKKLNHITVLTNSTLTTANARIEALEKMLKVEEAAGKAEARGEALPNETTTIGKET